MRRFTTHPLIRPLLGCVVALFALLSGLVALWAQLPSAAPVSQTGPTLGPPTPAVAPSSPDELLRYLRNVPGDSKPVQLSADEVATWNQNGEQVVLLRGRVLVVQSVVTLRCQQAVVWVDTAGYKTRGIWHVETYAEGDVVIDSSSERRESSRAFVQLNTRGEIKMNSVVSRLARLDLSGDPLVQRGLQVRRPPAPTPASVGPAMPRPPGSPPSILPVSQTGVVSQTGPAAPAPVPVLQTGPQPLVPTGGGLARPTDSVPMAAPPTPPAAPSLQQTRYQDPVPAAPATTTPGAAVPQTGPAAVPGTAPLPGGGPSLPPSTSARPPDTPPPPLPPPSRPGRGPRPDEVKVEGPARQYSVLPRTGSSGFDIKQEPLPGGEQAIIVTGGIILQVRNAPNIELVDLEADRLVIFAHQTDMNQVLGNVQGRAADGGPRENGVSNDLEFYLSGNVELRQQTGKVKRTIKAEEIYYDIKRNVAICYQAEMAMRPPRVIQDVYVKAPEIRQTDATHYEAYGAEFYSSRLPSDPALKVVIQRADIEERTVPMLSLFGQPMTDRETGKPLVQQQSWVKARNVVFDVANVPVFYSPYVVGDARDPLGPIEGLHMGYNKIFGAQVGLDLNVYDLLHVQPYQGTRWIFSPDYLSARGPNLATQFDYGGKDLWGIPSKFQGTVLGTAIYDHGEDNLGGFRAQVFEPTAWRGRALWREQVYELPYGFTVQSQFAYLSDRNYLEQFYKPVYEGDYPWNTYLYVKEQQDNWAWTAWANYRMRSWVWETQWLPRGDAYLLGEDFLGLFTYSTHASAGWAFLRPSSDPVPPVNPQTDVYDKTFRGDWNQEVSLPFTLGALRVAPYVKLDLTAYSNDVNGDSIGRYIAGGGARATMPFTRLFPDVDSELFNLNGINHKIVLGTNYYAVHSNTPYSILPQLDRVNDDISDQAVRDIRQMYPYFYSPSMSNALINSPLYNPQLFAIRRLVQGFTDTQDSIQALQLDINQRWQTKRGYPGAQHIVDWMTLDVSGTYFPNPNDNFGNSWAFLEYDYLWNIGDRTSILSNGWIDPFTDGARVFNIGTNINRPDRTSFFVNYRYIYPLQSQAVLGSITYIMSPKYAFTAGVTYDFGTQPFVGSTLLLTRIGTDLQMSVGFSYSSLQNSINGVVMLIPNLVPANNRRAGGIGLAGTSAQAQTEPDL